MMDEDEDRLKKKSRTVATVFTFAMMGAEAMSEGIYDALEKSKKPADPLDYHHASSKPVVKTPPSPPGRHIPRKVRRAMEKKRLNRK